MCKAWQHVAYFENLWHEQCRALEPHVHLARDDLLPGEAAHGPRRRCPATELHSPITTTLPPVEFAGSYRVYCGWRWPQLRRCVRRIVVESDHAGLEISTHEAPLLPSIDGTGGPAQQGSCAEAAAPASSLEVTPGAWVQQATASPCGNLVAFTEMHHNVSSVVVACTRSGRRVAAMPVAAPFPPFYYMWSACSTRLLFLRQAKLVKGGWGG